MKRLTSILLALLMLVGMALAEETPDPAVGDWYGLFSDIDEVKMTMCADGTFLYGDMDGWWWKTDDGAYQLTYRELFDPTCPLENRPKELTQNMTMTLTDYGAELSEEGLYWVFMLTRDVEDLRRIPAARQDTPLEALQGTWTLERVTGASMLRMYQPELGERVPYCTIDGTTFQPGLGSYFATDESFELTFENGVLSGNIMVGGADLPLAVSFFRAEDGSMYATVRNTEVIGASTNVILLIPMD